MLGRANAASGLENPGGFPWWKATTVALLLSTS